MINWQGGNSLNIDPTVKKCRTVKVSCPGPLQGAPCGAYDKMYDTMKWQTHHAWGFYHPKKVKLYQPLCINKNVLYCK